MNYVHGFHPTETAANTLRWWLRKMKPVIFPVWRQMVEFLLLLYSTLFSITGRISIRLSTNFLIGGLAQSWVNPKWINICLNRSDNFPSLTVDCCHCSVMKTSICVTLPTGFDISSIPFARNVTMTACVVVIFISTAFSCVVELSLLLLFLCSVYHAVSVLGPILRHQDQQQ